MNCREYIIEFEERGTLSETATLHLTICADCRQTSARQTQIWLLIDDLKPVAAPSDFDFHVKARIAKAQPSDFQSPRFLPILRRVLPVSAVLVFGFVLLNLFYFSGSRVTPPVAESEVEKPFAKNPSADNFPSNQIAFAPPVIQNPSVEPILIDDKGETAINRKPSLAAKNPSRRNRSENITTIPVKNDHLLASNAPVIILPKGINQNSNKTIESASNVGASKPIDDDDILAVSGIETVSDKGLRTVTAVRENSLGARSGVKVGDVVEKINERKNGGKSLSIARGAEKLEITLQNSLN